MQNDAAAERSAHVTRAGAIRGGHAPAVMPHYLANAVAAAKETPDE